MPETKILPVLPLRDIVVFPHQPVPLFVGREKTVRALEEAMRQESKEIVLVTQRDKDEDDPKPDTIYDVGVVAVVLQLLKLPDGTVKVLVEGRSRAKIVRFTDQADFYEGEVTAIAEDGEG
jgi:ATP-dependent Lon protease